MDGCWNPFLLGCVVDWSAWAAIATAAAVISGAVAVWFEARRAHRAQRADWAEAERIRRNEADAKAARLRAKTAVLAMAVHKEVWRAITQLRALLEALRQLESMDLDSLLSMYANGLPDVFAISRQIVDHMEGFAPMDANAILNGVAIWKDVLVFGQPVPSNLNRSTLLEVRPRVLVQVHDIVEVYRQLMVRLAPYVENMEGVEWIDAQDLIAKNEARKASLPTPSADPANPPAA